MEILTDLSSSDRLFVEQNAYKRALKYYEALSDEVIKREGDIRKKASELTMKKQNLAISEASLPILIDPKKAKAEFLKVQNQIRELNKKLEIVLSDIHDENEYYQRISFQVDQKIRKKEQRKQKTLLHSNAAKQLNNVQEKTHNKYLEISKKEEELIRTLNEMHKREETALKKESKLKFFLIEPINTCDIDEIILEDIEKEVDQLEYKLKKTQNIYDLYKEVDSDLCKLEYISKKNQQRKKDLSFLQSKNYANSPKSKQRNNYNYTFTKNIHNTNLSKTVSPKKTSFLFSKAIQSPILQKTMASEKAKNKLDELSESLIDRGQKLIESSDNICKLELENNSEFLRQEKMYNEKVDFIKKNISELNLRKEIQEKLVEKENQNLLLVKKLDSLLSEKGQIIRTSQNLIEQRKMYESRKDDLKKLSLLLELKNNEILDNSQKIMKRKEIFQNEEKQFEILFHRYKNFEINVLKLEEEARIYEAKIQESCVEINKSLVIIDEKARLSYSSFINDKSSSFAESFL